MENSFLFTKNLKFLLDGQPNFIAEKNIDLNLAKKRAEESDCEEEAQSWRNSEYNRMLTLPRFLPENQASCDELAEILSDYHAEA